MDSDVFEFKKKRNRLGFGTPATQLAQKAVDGGIINYSKSRGCYQLPLLAIELLRPYIELISGEEAESFNGLITASFKRSGKEKPAELDFLHNCAAILSLKLEDHLENIQALAGGRNLFAAHLFLGLAVYVKDVGVERGIIRPVLYLEKVD